MMAKLAVLALVLSTSACAMTPQAKRAAIVGSAVAIAAGVVTSLVVAPNHCKDLNGDTSLVDGFGCLNEASMLYGAGATIATAGLVGLVATASSSTIEPPPAPVAREALPPVAVTAKPWATDNVALQQLSTKASIAAKVGQCEYVEQIAAQVSAIDPSYRSTGFIADPAISDCL